MAEKLVNSLGGDAFRWAEHKGNEKHGQVDGVSINIHKQSRKLSLLFCTQLPHQGSDLQPGWKWNGQEESQPRQGLWEGRATRSSEACWPGLQDVRMDSMWTVWGHKLQTHTRAKRRKSQHWLVTLKHVLQHYKISHIKDSLCSQYNKNPSMTRIVLPSWQPLQWRHIIDINSVLIEIEHRKWSRNQLNKSEGWLSEYSP